MLKGFIVLLSWIVFGGAGVKMSPMTTDDVEHSYPVGPYL